MSPAIGPLAVLPRPGDGYGGLDGDLASDELRRNVDAEVRRIVDECDREAHRLLEQHRVNLDALVDALLEEETLDAVDAYRAAGLEVNLPASLATQAPA
jgi:cell division protease FtsH